MLGNIIRKWEERLSRKDTNRVTFPFEWGLDCLNHGFVPGKDELESVYGFNSLSMANSDEFFAMDGPEIEFEVEGERLLFKSQVTTSYEVNNRVCCRIFRAKDDRGRAAVVLPQWNAAPESHTSLCRLLQRLGITALRLTLPYHEDRNPVGPRADYMVSANIGRTIQAIRQAVVDARSAGEWLFRNGYRRVGAMGSSVGSCIAFLAFVHDPRFSVGVFNHVSSFFGDVVWHGISTRHVRKGIEGVLNAEELRRAWAVISPNSYIGRLQNDSRKYLYISALYDLTFPPDLARLLFEEHDRLGIGYQAAFIPCGHYSSARTPFKFWNGYLISNYFRKHL